MTCLQLASLANVSLDYTTKYEDNNELCGKSDHGFNSIRAVAKSGVLQKHAVLTLKGVYKCSGNNVPWTSILSAGNCAFEDGEHLGEDDITFVSGSNDLTNDNHIKEQEFEASETTITPDTSGQSTNHQSRLACGKRSLDREELTKMRTNAKPGDWPWEVSIYFMNFRLYAGSIISRTTIITVNFAIGTFLNELVIVAGTSNLGNLEDLNSTEIQKLKPKGVILFQNASSDWIDASYHPMIIKVEEFVFNKYVRPICLWGPVYDDPYSLAKEDVVVGFGLNANATLLKPLDIKIIPHEKCDQLLNYTQGLSICTERTWPTLVGEIGGGLIIPKTDQHQKITWFLRGSFADCGSGTTFKCDIKKPSMYVDLAPYYSWIYHNSGL
ncbi:chymotrypsinogen A-like [Anticarsia gemmatalis]|uniref:chymotrypsinogen A-like n=1 Tax=Anticarsia gemmatalis TaxID=129554 RepID=UPI003F772930